MHAAEPGVAERLGSALALLQAHARPDQLAGMARFGLVGQGRLGLSVPQMRAVAKALGRDHDLALALFDSGTPDARIVAALVAEVKRLTPAQMDHWIAGFDAWDVCDQACNQLFARSPHAWAKVAAWSSRAPEFERRAAFSLLSALAVHDKKAPDSSFVDALALIESAADDQRNFVRKAVNWALRSIGKRNRVLNEAAIACALRIRERGTPAARWIASDALRELQSPAVLRRLAR